MTVHVHESERSRQPGPGHESQLLIGEEQGASHGFCMGVSYYMEEGYGAAGVHDDQEGFYVLEGTGTAKVGDIEFAIRPGSSFIAAVGVAHSIKRDPGSQAIKVLWSHGAV